MTTKEVLLIVVLACAAAFGSVFLDWSPPQASAPVPARSATRAIDADDLARIEARLDGIESALSILTSARTQRHPLEVEVEPARDPLADILERIENMEHNLLKRAAMTGHSPRGGELDRRAPVDWNEYDALRRQETGDGKAAIRELRLMTPGEVTERFGAPSRADATNGSDWDMWWSYDHHDGTSLQLYFKAGYVLYAKLH